MAFIPDWVAGSTFVVGFLAAAVALGADAQKSKANAYEYTFNTLSGKEKLPLSQFKGSVVLVVNTASRCGYTPQYEGLEALYKKYKDKGLVVLGVPSNDFGAQEPGSNEDIAKFCKLNYGVSFPMAGKEVVVGDKAHPFYLWAKKTLGDGSAPKWNFSKYLIGRNGELVTSFESGAAPQSDKVLKAVETALTAKP